MKVELAIASVLLLVACGGGNSTSNDIGAPAPVDRYTTSYPLVDNSNASDYKILVMGNSHASALSPVLEQVLFLGQTGKSVDVHLSPGSGHLSGRVNDGYSEQTLESENWTHVILQGQKYSTTGTLTYPTDAAEYWIRGSKEQGATPILFPEHPRTGNTWEGQTLWELHTGIASRESACVAPVGLVWDEVIFRDTNLVLNQPDGNHAAEAGLLLTALVFYQIITGDPVESLPELSSLGVDTTNEQAMKQSAATILFNHRACNFDE